MKNTQSKIKPIKVGKQSGATIVFGVKIIQRILKMTNKVLREKFHCVVC